MAAACLPCCSNGESEQLHPSWCDLGGDSHPKPPVVSLPSEAALACATRPNSCPLPEGIHRLYSVPVVLAPQEHLPPCASAASAASSHPSIAHPGCPTPDPGLRCPSWLPIPRHPTGAPSGVAAVPVLSSASRAWGFLFCSECAVPTQGRAPDVSACPTFTKNKRESNQNIPPFLLPARLPG